jgi:lysophospholipase L1-like esterase
MPRRQPKPGNPFFAARLCLAAAWLVLLALPGAPQSGPGTAYQFTNSSNSSNGNSSAKKKHKTARKPAVKKRPARKPHAYAPRVKVSPATRSQSLEFVRQQVGDPSPEWIEQPDALDPFFSQLAALESGDAPRLARILQFGDSHTAADEFTGQMRTLFQQHFGDGGAGFSFAGRPFAGYRIHGTGREQSGDWVTIGTHFREPNDGLLGLGGVAIETATAGDSIFLEAPAAHAELQYLQQPGGGDLTLADADSWVSEISTDGPSGPGYFVLDSSQEEHEFTAKVTLPSPVRLLGWVTENASGVTYEALGINGAEAPLILQWNEELQVEYLRRRAPALIVLAYGTNEASNRTWTLEKYRDAFAKVIERYQHAVPGASILVIGPPDRYLLARLGRHSVWVPFAGTTNIIQAQREVCQARRCAFWDLRERMGGYGSMRQWVYAQWAQADHVHFTAVGYHQLATAFYSDIMQQYQAYKRRRAADGERTADPQGPAERDQGTH